MPQDEVLIKATRLRKEGNAAQALQLLGDAIRRGSLGPEAIDRVGRFVLREFNETLPGGSHLKILLLGQCTTSWIKNALAAVSWGAGVASTIREGGYDNIIQELARLGTDELPDILVLLPWNERLLATGIRSAEDRIEEEIAFWRHVWRIASERRIDRIIQVGYDWTVPGARGYHLARRPGGDVHLIQQVNKALEETLPDGAYFVPLEEISGSLGRMRFYDPRRFYWTKQPFSEVGSVILSNHIYAGIRAITTGPKKVLVLDLDNTLWGGVVGEAGSLGISLGDSPEGAAYRSFQTYLKALSKHGVLLAVCSKNNPSDAREPFENNLDMVLSLDDFADFVANWESKADNLCRIAKNLNLGLDTFVFFDDSKSEQELIRQSLPMVEVVNVPEDPSEYIRTLQDGLWFETRNLTKEDELRTAQYVAEHKRRNAESSATSIEEYLASLQMQALVRPIDEADMQRVVQLLAKTNQFNLTTRRHTADKVRELIRGEGALGVTLRLTDRFGDYGLVAVIIGVPLNESQARTLKIDTFVMSCRVIGRTVEECVIDAVMRRAEEMGYQRVLGEYLPTQKNQLVYGLYEQLGFSRLPTPSDNSTPFELRLPPERRSQSFIQLAN